MAARPCLKCGVIIRSGSRCADCTVPRTRRQAAKRTRDKSLRARVLRRDHYVCAECRWHDPSGRTLEMDHIVPLSDGGSRSMSNCITLCRQCHRRKTAHENSLRQGGPGTRAEPIQPLPAAPRPLPARSSSP
jgi:5-methylcytosine-specific restriction endonuclease McrA